MSAEAGSTATAARDADAAEPAAAAAVAEGANGANGADVAGPPESAAEPAAVAPRGPGGRLRAARTGRGLSVQQVVDALHMETRLVEALENDRYDAFDAPVYARGFLRKYGSWLELPADELLQSYEALHSGPVDPTLLPPASAEVPPRDWAGWRNLAVAALALVAVGGSYWWWLRAAPSARDAAELPAEPVLATGPAEPVDATADAGVVGAPGTADGASAGAGRAADGAVGDPGTGPYAGDAGASPGSAVAAVPGAGAPRPPATAAPVGAPGALSFAFTADCWLEVYAADGRRLAFDLYGPGDAPSFAGPGPWRVFLGSADAARVAIGGRPVAIPPGARSGAIARFEVARDGTARVPAG